MPRLSQILLAIVRNESWWPRVIRAALGAYIYNSVDSPNRMSDLRQLLADIYAGRVSDPDNEMLGTLLTNLYPHEIPASEVWDYLKEEGGHYFIGRYLSFWDRGLLDRSSDDEVADLLDHLHERLPGLRSSLEGSGAFELPMKLLARGLKVHGEDLETTRLYNWLRVGAYRSWEGPISTDESDGSIGQVRAWLERRPEIQKAVVVEGLIRCPDNGSFVPCSSSVWNVLHGSTLPPDFGLWSLKRAIELVETYPRVSECLLQHAVYLLKRRTNDRGLTRAVLAERTRGHEILEKHLANLLDPPIHVAELKRDQRIEKYHEEDKRREDQWIEFVRSNACALRENRAVPALLFNIGRAYFGYYPSRARNATAEQRIRELLGNDADLIEAALAGLRGTVWRDDVPELGEIIRLNSESRMHHLGLPFLAGMDEIERAAHTELSGLSDSQKRKALAFYYYTPTYRSKDARWYLRWLDSFPGLVANVLTQCAVSAVRAGEKNFPGLAKLAHMKNHAQVAGHACLPLLRAFPVRCTSQQIGALDLLLWAALQHSNEASLRALIEQKLSRRSMHASQRTHWLAAGVLVAPKTYRKPLENFVGGREGRTRQLAAFFCPDTPLPFLTDELQVPTLKILIKLIGTSFGPLAPNGWITLETEASDQVKRMIQQLANRPGHDAAQALETLSADPALASLARRSCPSSR